MWWNLNGPHQPCRGVGVGVGVVHFCVVVAVVLGMCCSSSVASSITSVPMSSSTTSPTSSASSGSSSTNNLTDRVVDAAAATAPTATGTAANTAGNIGAGDKRPNDNDSNGAGVDADADADADIRRPDVADHHQSNDLAISPESPTAATAAEKRSSGVDGRLKKQQLHDIDIDDDDSFVSIDDVDDDDAASMPNDQPHQHRRSAQPHVYRQRQPPPPPSSSSFAHHSGSDHGAEPTGDIHIRQGALRGLVRRWHPQTKLRPVHQFLGIPYAAAPTGSGRFMPPGAPPPWHADGGAREFTRLAPVCPQQLPALNGTAAGRYDQLKRLLPFLRPAESEDCLFLNLYAPAVKATEGGGVAEQLGRVPVIVFVHGESYEWNSGNAYDGAVLASYGQVVVVTLNYRLGILGFLKPGTGDHTVANFGLLDQIAALQWVKDNIAAFGGNSQAVTLMGHGTGAACVNLLMVSPVARGLFHRAILMSGSALADWAVASRPLATTMQVVQSLNCPLRDDGEEMLQCLRKKRYQEIMQQHISATEFGTVFGPVVDNLVVPNQPHKIMGQYNEMFSRYDLLFGLTEIESYHMLHAVGLRDGLKESERDACLRAYMQNRYELRPDVAMALTLQEYTDLYNDPLRPLPAEHRDTLLEILSDARVAAPLLQTGLFHSRVNPRSYMYVFGHNSHAGEFANHPQSIAGEELPYVFGAPLAATQPFPTKYSAEERLLSESMMLAWTNFAKTGNPRAPKRDFFVNLQPRDWERYDIDWPEFNATTQYYLNIGIPPVVQQKYREKYMRFWQHALPDELNRTRAQKQPPPPPFGQRRPAAAGAADAAHISYYADRTTQDPFRTLKLLLHPEQGGGGRGAGGTSNDHSMYNTQSTMVTATIIDNGTPYAAVNTFNSDGELQLQRMPGQTPDHQDDQRIVVRADSTLSILLTVFATFLLLNVLAIAAYAVRRYYTQKAMPSAVDGGVGGAKLSAGGLLRSNGCGTASTKHTHNGRAGACAADDNGGFGDVAANGGGGGAAQRLKQYNSNDYETVMTMSDRPRIHGYLQACDLGLNAAAVDAHTKVSDWMSQEIRNGDQQQLQPALPPPSIQGVLKCAPRPLSFSLKGRRFFRRCIKPTANGDGSGTVNDMTPTMTMTTTTTNAAATATPTAADAGCCDDNCTECQRHRDHRSPSSCASSYAKPRSYDTIICQDVAVDARLIDGSMDLRAAGGGRRSSIPSLRGSVIDGPTTSALKIDHRHSRSDPVPMFYRRAPAPDEDITFFIDDPAMSSARPDSTGQAEPVSPSADAIRMRNYPRVLPGVPDASTEYVQSALIKRRSLPPQYISQQQQQPLYGLRHPPPAPPPRTTSTLGRNAGSGGGGGGRRDSNLLSTSPLQMAAEPAPLPGAEPEPEITCNVLHVGPLLPKSTESIYSTVSRAAGSRTPRTPRSPGLAAAAQTPQFTFENCVVIETGGEADGPDALEQSSQLSSVVVPRTAMSGIRPPMATRASTESLPSTAGKPKVAMRPPSLLLRQTSTEHQHLHRMSVQSIPEEGAMPTTTTSTPLTGKVISSRIPQARRRDSADRSGSEETSTSGGSSSSGAETVKQVF